MKTKTATAVAAAAKQLIQQPGTPATVLLAAAKKVLGDFLAWEPESIWLELTARGIDVPEVNKSKLQAAITLMFVPSFYWDAVVFEKTALALDGVVVNADRLEEATSAQLAWAVKEAEKIVAAHGDPAHAFEHEPLAYAAVTLHREGLVLAPDALKGCQEQLEHLNGGTHHSAAVRDAWNNAQKLPLTTYAFDDDSVGVQLARLAAVELHCREMEARVASGLAQL